MNKVTYYIIQPETDTKQETFDKVLSSINMIDNVGIHRDDATKARVFYGKTQYQAQISLVHEKALDQQKEYGIPDSRIVVECEKADGITINMIRDVALAHDFRVFSQDLNYYLPKNLGLLDLLTGINNENEKAANVLRKHNLKPIFWVWNTYSYYAQHSKDNSIHIVNDNLINYLIKTETTCNTNELSYRVANDIPDFVSKYDVELIPMDFYQYYRRKFKIINFSGFNINNPGRKVFVKPYILELNKEKQGFFRIAWDQSALLFMDKIRSGETLDGTIKRILKDELGIAHDYIGATVARTVEFDLDKNNRLTPRLIVRIYIKEAHMTDQQKNQKNRAWISFDQVKQNQPKTVHQGKEFS